MGAEILIFSVSTRESNVLNSSACPRSYAFAAQLQFHQNSRVSSVVSSNTHRVRIQDKAKRLGEGRARIRIKVETLPDIQRLTGG